MITWWDLLESKANQFVFAILCNNSEKPYAMSIINKEEEEPVSDNNTTAKDAQEEKMTQQNNKKEKRKSDRQLTKDRASEVCVTTTVCLFQIS